MAKIAGYYGELETEIRKKLLGTADLNKKTRLDMMVSFVRNVGLREKCEISLSRPF